MNSMDIWTDWKSWLEILFLFGILVALAIPLGRYIAKVYQGEPLWLDKLLGPIERLIYKVSWVAPIEQMSWKIYTKAVLALGVISFFLLYVLLIFQAYLPLNPQHYPGVSHDLAFNIAISFLTNTNWQSYEGEKVLSYFTQMAGLSVQNFISAATGMAIAVALIRGIIRSGASSLGNFWVDLTRGILYILLPLSIIMAILLGSEGVIQNFNDYLFIPSIDINSTTQIIPGGPVASQVAIKQLGSNGGGFFAANSAHPFENPSPFSNFLQLLAMLLIPVSFIVAYGRMIHLPKQGSALLWLLFMVLILGFVFCVHYELNSAVVNDEGKEYRHGMLNSILWAITSAATSNGSTNSLLESFFALTAMIPLLFILTGEVIFGGVGQGLYTLLLYIFITVFIASLMAGRMPQYLGKKIEVFDIKMTMLALLIPVITILVFFAISVQIPDIKQQLSVTGEKGFSELLYAFASTTGNNGSAFHGLKSNTPCLNVFFGLTMLLGRYGVIIPVLAIAGNFISKSTTLEQTQHFMRVSIVRTDSVVFMVLLCNVIVILSLLSFMPILLMGPIAQHLAEMKIG